MRILRNLPPAALIVIGIVAAFLYSNFIIDWVLRGFEGMGEIVSYLEAPGEPNALILRITDVICAALVLFLLPALRAALPRGRAGDVLIVSTFVFAAGAALAAVVASPCAPDDPTCAPVAEGLRSFGHDTFSVVSDVALYVGVAAGWAATRTEGPTWFRRFAAWNFVLGGVVASLLFLVGNDLFGVSWANGAAQRVHIVFMSLWLVALAAYAAGHHEPDRAPGRAAGHPACR